MPNNKLSALTSGGWHRTTVCEQLLPETEKAQSVTPQTTKYRYRTVISAQWIHWKFDKKVGPQRHYFCQYLRKLTKVMSLWPNGNMKEMKEWEKFGATPPVVWIFRDNWRSCYQLLFLLSPFSLQSSSGAKWNCQRGLTQSALRAVSPFDV